VPAPARGNLADLVRDSAARAGERPALLHVPADGPPTTVTWAELDRDVDATAAGMLSGLDLSTGDRVALVLSNTPAFVTAYFGALRAGLVAVPVNTGYTSPEIARVLGTAGVAAVICEDATVPVVEEAVVSTHRAVVDPAGLDSLTAAGRGAGPQQPGAGGEDLALLMFTSGTSGRPRGAMLSHRALVANIEQCRRLEPTPMRADDVVLLVLPLFHIYGLNTGLGMVAATGATGLLAERFDPSGTLELVREHGVTNIPGAPPMYVAWADGALPVDALRGVRMLASGASPLPPAVLGRMQTEVGVTVYEGYGLTETAPVVSTTLASRRVKPGSIGRPVPGVEVRLLDESGGPVENGDPGEIWVRGENLFSGYWPDGAEGPDAGGWWGTGDVAYADEDGDLFIVDRRKELVLVSGFNVYPREVEDVIAEHPDVLEVAVIAVPDPSTGEAVKAFVVPRPGATLRPEDVSAHAATRLARFKRPTVVAIVGELPHSATGKVAKGALREAELPEGGVR
jgi:long-chain acyl-CoA synthetase